MFDNQNQNNQAAPSINGEGQPLDSFNQPVEIKTDFQSSLSNEQPLSPGVVDNSVRPPEGPVSFQPPAAPITSQQFSQPDLTIAEIGGQTPESLSREPVFVPPSSPPISQPVEARSFNTPELAKKDIIQKADDIESGGEGMVHVMADKFKKFKPKAPGGGNKKTKLIIGLIVLLLIIAGAAFYFLGQQYLPGIWPKVKEQPKESMEKVSQETVETEKTEELAAPVDKTIKKETLDELGGEIVKAEFLIPAGALEKDLEIEIINGLLTVEESAEYEKDYKVIGGVYKFSAKKGMEEKPISEIIFNKPGVLKVFYNQTAISEDWESDLALAYFKDSLWTPLTFTLDTEKNELTAELSFFPSEIIALVVDKTKTVPKVEKFQIAPEIASSLDTDNDGLTDVEENVYQTEVSNPDTDSDGAADGQELLNLNDPLQSGETKLATSSLISVYTNPTFSYSFFYPSSWLVKAIPETDNQEVLVITNTGEFFSVTVDNNSENLSAADWYLKQSPNVDKNLLTTVLVNNYEAVWNPEHLTIYIIKEDKVYILSYNVGTEKEANFKTTFEMIINSFQFVVKTVSRPDGSLIKYGGQEQIYLIDNGKKRAFASLELFEKLGFKQDEVVEIPETEVYPDGEPINWRLDGALIKYPEQPGVYLIEDGKKRAFASGEIFEKLGFKWDQVVEVSNEEIYPDGPIINSDTTTSESAVE